MVIIQMPYIGVNGCWVCECNVRNSYFSCSYPRYYSVLEALYTCTFLLESSSVVATLCSLQPIITCMLFLHVTEGYAHTIKADSHCMGWAVQSLHTFLPG